MQCKVKIREKKGNNNKTSRQTKNKKININKKQKVITTVK